MTGGSYTALTPPAEGEVIQRQWGLDVRDSCILRFASATARDAALTGLSASDEGLMAYLTDVNAMTVYNGSAWKYLYSEPICSLTTGSSQTIAHATATDVLFDTEITDTLGWHSTSSNTARITPNVAGWYQVQGKVGYLGVAAAGGRVAYVHQNGTAINGSGTYLVATTNYGISVATAVVYAYCNGSTDYLTLNTNQTSGTSIGLDYTNPERSCFSARLVRSET